MIVGRNAESEAAAQLIPKYITPPQYTCTKFQYYINYLERPPTRQSLNAAKTCAVKRNKKVSHI